MLWLMHYFFLVLVLSTGAFGNTNSTSLPEPTPTSTLTPTPSELLIEPTPIISGSIHLPTNEPLVQTENQGSLEQVTDQGFHFTMTFLERYFSARVFTQYQAWADPQHLMNRHPVVFGIMSSNPLGLAALGGCWLVTNCGCNPCLSLHNQRSPFLTVLVSTLAMRLNRRLRQSEVIFLWMVPVGVDEDEDRAALTQVLTSTGSENNGFVTNMRLLLRRCSEHIMDDAAALLPHEEIPGFLLSGIVQNLEDRRNSIIMDTNDATNIFVISTHTFMTSRRSLTFRLSLPDLRREEFSTHQQAVDLTLTQLSRRAGARYLVMRIIMGEWSIGF